MELEAIEREIDLLDIDVSKLLEWCREKTRILNERQLDNNLDGLQKQLESFKAYRLDEKPPKYFFFSLFQFPSQYSVERFCMSKDFINFLI